MNFLFEWSGLRGRTQTGARRPLRAHLGLTAALALAACQAEPPATPLTPEQSAALAPGDARIAALYDRSCKSCHTVADTGAPLTGDRIQWDARWTKGEAALLDSTIRGLNGMPAGGQCFSCSPEDYGALIRFMAGRD